VDGDEGHYRCTSSRLFHGPRPDPQQLMGKRENGSKFHPTKFWFFCEWFYTAISNYHAMFSAKLGI
jgi:hypothetical protein